MSVSGIGPIGGVSSGGSVYAVLSPYLNGVVRTSNAAAAAKLDAAAQTKNPAVAQAAIAAQGVATAAAAALPPFANPAITSISQRIALGQALGATTAVTPDALLGSTAIDAPVPVTVASAPDQRSATNSVLTGDSGLLVQSYGAVALLSGIQAATSVFAQAATPLIPATAAVTPVSRVSAIA